MSSKGRTRKISSCLRESIAQGLTYPLILGFGAVVEQQLDEIFLFEVSHDWFLQEEENMSQPVTYNREDIGNILHYHEAINQPDAIKFAKAIINKINGHVENGDWELVPRNTIPEGVNPVPLVWSMQQKCDLVTDEAVKYKAHPKLHGSKQELGVHYFETFAPVVTLMAIRFLLVLAILICWSMRQIDFVMAYTQAPIECEMYMTLPHGISTWYGCAKDYVLRLINNIYGQKQASKVFADYRDENFWEKNIKCLVVVVVVL